jgi:hypothetical protein
MSDELDWRTQSAAHADALTEAAVVFDDVEGDEP